jgi:tetratricopeptide (TPR) repeat protein
LALALRDLSRLSESRAELRAIVSADPSDKSSTLVLALVEQDLGNRAEAEKLLSAVTDWVARYPDPVLALAQGYYRTAENAKAASVLAVLLRSGRVSPDAIFSAASLAAAADDPATAAQLLDGQVRRRGDADARAYNLLGHARANQGKLTEAAEAFEQAIAREPSAERHYLDLARTLASFNQWRATIGVANKAVARFPESEPLYELKGFAEKVLLMTSESLKSYQRALEINPRSPRANLGLAMAQRAAGMTDAAAATFERGIRQFPQDALHYQEYALMLLKQGPAMEERSVPLLEKALALDGTLSEAHFELGNLLLRWGDTARALPHLERAARLEPNVGKMHYAAARAYTRAGRPADAAREMQAYRQLKETEDASRNSTGAAITGVAPGSRGEKAGLRTGDVITAANGKPVADMEEFHQQMSAMPPGSTVVLTVQREGRRLEIPVSAGEHAGP